MRPGSYFVASTVMASGAGIDVSATPACFDDGSTSAKLCAGKFGARMASTIDASGYFAMAGATQAKLLSPGSS